MYYMVMQKSLRLHKKYVVLKLMHRIFNYLILKRDYNHGLICSVEGCDAPEKARGLCSTHYKRWERHGRSDAVYKPWGTK